jgi:hypothetical protein
LTDDVITAVLAKLTSGVTTISAVSLEWGDPNGLLAIIMEEMQQKQSNTIAIVKHPDRKTYNSWAKIILEKGNCVMRSAELKAQGRKKPFLNMRNNVAYAATIRCLFVQLKVHPELLLSTDDVSILVHPSMSALKPMVIAPKIALEWLRQNGIGVSTTAQELYKQRMITFKITISRTYDVSTSIIVYDRSFLEYKDKPAIYDMGDRLYVVLAHPGIDQQLLEFYIECGCIEPQEMALR